MTAADREHLGKALYGLGEVFNEPVSDVKVALYFDALDDLTWAALQPACRLAVRQCRFFPRPAELRELVLGRAEDAAERAFGRLQTLVRRVGSWGAPAYDDLVLNGRCRNSLGRGDAVVRRCRPRGRNCWVWRNGSDRSTDRIRTVWCANSSARGRVQCWRNGHRDELRDWGLHASAGPDAVSRLPVGVWTSRRPPHAGGRHAAAAEPDARRDAAFGE